MPIYVNKPTLDLLAIGNELIGLVRGHYLPYGAANQKYGPELAPVETRETGDRYILAAKRRDTVVAATPEKTLHQRSYASKMTWAASAVASEAGNCDEMASLTYVLARGRAPANVRASFVQDQKFHHCFVVLRTTLAIDADSVVVDPWPRHAQAVRVGDFFCPLVNFKVDNAHDKQCGKDMNARIAKLSSRLAPVEQAELDAMARDTIAIRPTYNHEYCAASKAKLEYKLLESPVPGSNGALRRQGAS